MRRAGNLNIWPVILLFLLTIVGTLGANEKIIQYDIAQSASDLVTTAQDGNSPTIRRCEVGTFHELNSIGRDSYRIDAWAVVDDPQGPNDIAMVKVIDANDNEFDMYRGKPGSYHVNPVYDSTQPPLGNTQFVAIDKSGNSDTESKTLTNIIQGLPTLLFPKDNELISLDQTQPIFDWNDVTDTNDTTQEQSTITYDIKVDCQDSGAEIWQASGLTKSEAQFDSNDPLQENMCYTWYVHAEDGFGNKSYATGSFDIGSPIPLGNDHLDLKLHPFRPCVERYELKSTGAVMYGDTINENFSAAVHYKGELHYVRPSVDGTPEQENGRVRYHMRAEVEPNLGVNFDLCYELDDNTVKVVFNNITEDPNCLLVFVRSPSLLTVRAKQPGAKLVFPEAQGWLIDVESANPEDADIDLINGTVHRPLLAGMVYHDGLIGVAHYDHLDMMLWTQIIDHDSEGNLATIGATFNYRYAPNDPNDAPTAGFIDVFDDLVTSTTELIVDLKFLTDFDGDSDVDWMDGAKYLRDQVQATPDKRYLKSFITKIAGHESIPVTKPLEWIEEIYHLTDHNKTFVYLCGYNDLSGQVFGEPNDVWPHWSEGILEVFQDAEELYNTYVSFNDIYTNYYEMAPYYYPHLRVIKANGLPIQYRDGSYYADPYDYAIKVGIDRIRRTLEAYPIKESYHIDALSVCAVKDHSLGSPSSRERNRCGIKLIIDEFDTNDVDVTSEYLTGQYAELGIGWYLNIPWNVSSTLPFGNEEFIPLMAFIYHGKTLYAINSWIFTQLPPVQEEMYTFKENLLLGASSGAHIGWEWTSTRHHLDIDKFYLIDLPWIALNERFMEDYQVQGSRRRITYDPNTFVEVDYEQDTYTVQVDGRIIAENYTTCFPKTENRFLIFSLYEKQICVTLPQRWLDEDERVIELHALTEEGVGDTVPFQIGFGNLSFYADPNTPYRLDLVIPGDCDGDSDVDATDLAVFASAWLTGPGDAQWNPACDISIPADNSVDVLDLVVFVDNWLTGVK